MMGNCCHTEPDVVEKQPIQPILGQSELFTMRKELHESIKREAILRGNYEQLRKQTQVLIDRNHYLEMCGSVSQKIPIQRPYSAQN